MDHTLESILFVTGGHENHSEALNYNEEDVNTILENMKDRKLHGASGSVKTAASLQRWTAVNEHPAQNSSSFRAIYDK